MGMKTLLMPCLLSVPMLGACVLTTDFEGSTEDTGSSDASASYSDTGVEPTDSMSDEASDTAPASSCGDGVLAPDEVCDDANQIDGDGCESDCTILGGEILWTVEDVDFDAGRSVAALPDGGFVVGGVDGVLRYDAEGQQLWAQTAMFEERQLGGLTVSPEGNVLVVGTILLDPDFAVGEIWVGELSVEDGSELWTNLPDVPAESAWGQVIAADSEGTLRVAGFTGGEGGSDALMVGLAADGTLLWWKEETELSSGYAEATDVVVLPDGSAVFVAVSEFGPYPLWARQLDAAGQELWFTGFDHPDVFDVLGSIERRDDGSLVIVGLGEGTVVIELDENGVEQQRNTWKLDDVSRQSIQGTALGGNGRLYVAGDHREPDGGLYGALGLQGQELWSERFTDGGAFDTAVLADGNVVFVGFVTDGDGLRHLWLRKTGP